MNIKQFKGKYPKAYLDVLDKKCENSDCPNLKDDNPEGKCNSCYYHSKYKRMTDKEIAVVRHIFFGSMGLMDDKLLSQFNKENKIKKE